MTTNSNDTDQRRVPPPNKHQLALMIWLCVFPTLTVINFGVRRLASNHVARCADVRPRDHRSADRDLRVDASLAPAPGTAADELATVPRVHP